MLSNTITPYINAAFAGLWVETHEPAELERELAALCHANEWQFEAWDIAEGMHGDKKASHANDPIGPVKAQMQKAGDGTKILLLHNYHHFIKSPGVAQNLANAVNEGKGERNFYVIASPTVALPPELEKLFTVVEHPLPSTEELRGILTDVWPDAATADDCDTVLDAASGLTRYEAENAFALSLAQHGTVTPQTVWELKAQSLRKTGYLSLHRGGETFSDLGGLDVVKEFCRKALAAKPGPHFADPAAGPRPRPRGILLLGVPGTGKSAFAKALGNECGRPTVVLDVGSLMGGVVGQTEQNVRHALRVVDAMAPCVLFVDEIEKALGGVDSSDRTDGGVGARLFGTLLTWCNDHTSDVFFIATCNDISKLPPEFSRAERFDGIFFMDLPGEAERRSIWQIYGTAFGIADASWANVDDDQWTGAEIKACCRLSALLGVPLQEAAEHVVPVAVTAADKVAALREWASGRCLHASRPGIYTSRAVKEAGRRSVKVRA